MKYVIDRKSRLLTKQIAKLEMLAVTVPVATHNLALTGFWIVSKLHLQSFLSAHPRYPLIIEMSRMYYDKMIDLKICASAAGAQ